MEGLHEYRENQRSTCSECARLFKIYGETDAQVQDVHEIEPISSIHTNEKKRKRSLSHSKSHSKKHSKKRGGKKHKKSNRKTHKK
jgi:hypothetical protein